MAKLPFFNNSTQKDRWLICLGTFVVCGKTQQILMSTTTTKMEEYTSGKSREKNITFVINRSKYSFFTNDCLIDLSLNPIEDVYPSTLEAQSGNWEMKGSIDQNDLRDIFNKLVRAESASAKVLSIIKDSLQSIGIQGLAKVK